MSDYSLIRACSVVLFAAITVTAYGSEEGLPLRHFSPENILPVTTIREPGTVSDPAVDLGMHIAVVAGEDGVNIVKRRTAVAPVVQVRDRNNQPIAGAYVTFTSPNGSPSLLFGNGAHSASLVTDSTGRATLTGVKPVGTGAFKLQVSAAFQGQTASTSISQTNYLTVAAAKASGAGIGAAATGASTGLSTGVIAVIAGAAAAAAIGTAVALMHGGGSSAASSSATIGLGTGVTVGAPH